MDVTGDQVRDAMKLAKIDIVVVRYCSLCDYPLNYIRNNDNVYFDSGCYCTGGHNIQQRSWDEVANLINMQCNQWKAKYKKMFGISPYAEVNSDEGDAND